MQAERDQHAVGEPVGEGPECAGTADELADAGEAGVEDRVEVAQREAHDQGRHRHHDRDEPAAAEEAEIRGQLDRVVLVEQHRGDQADQDAGEHAVVDLGLRSGHVDDALQDHRRHGLEDGLDDQVARRGGESGRTVGLFGEADGHADREQQRQVGEDRPARGTHRLEERSDDRGLDAAQQVGLAQAQQDAGGGQQGDRQHQALAEALQLREAGDAQPGLLLRRLRRRYRGGVGLDGAHGRPRTGRSFCVGGAGGSGELV